MDNDRNNIKVLIVAGRMDVGGIENQLMHLLRNADRSRFQIDFTTTDSHPFYEDEILSLGGRCIRVPETNGMGFFRYCRALYRIIRSGRYDVVHSNELFHSGMVLLTARLAGVKCRIAHAHSSNQSLGKSFVRRVYTAVMRLLIRCCATEFLACSTLAGEFLYGKKILKRPNYHLIVNSVETARFLPRPEDGIGSSGSPDGRKTILQVGRFCDEKNFAFSTRIAAECKRRGSRFRFLFVGNDSEENPYVREVRRIVAAEGLEDCVALLGVRRDVNDLMRQADAFLLPSKYEGMPLTLIEAQAACLPCVAADTFSHEADFGVGAVRWLRLDAPPEDWADTLELAVKTGRTDLAAVKQAILEKGFDVACFAEKLCAIYASGCKRGIPRG